MDEPSSERGWRQGLTLFIFSFLYKDNPLFKLAEISTWVSRSATRS